MDFSISHFAPRTPLELNKPLIKLIYNPRRELIRSNPDMPNIKVVRKEHVVLEKGEEGVVVSNVLNFKKIIGLVKDFVEIANIQFHDGKFSLTALDSSHISFVDLQLNIDYFLYFKISKPTRVGVNLVRLHRIISGCSKEDTIKMVILPDKLKISIVNHQLIKTYMMNLFNLEDTDLTIPTDIETTKIELSSRNFHQIIDDLYDTGDTTQFQLNSGKLALKTTGEIGELDITLKDDLKIPEEADMKLSFNNKLLREFTKGHNISDSITLEFKDEFPLIMGYTLGEQGYMRYYIAPKIDDFDD